VHADIRIIGTAATVSKKSRQRGDAAGPQWTAEHIDAARRKRSLLTHHSSPAWCQALH
jgi:hypothetical protein